MSNVVAYRGDLSPDHVPRPWRLGPGVRWSGEFTLAGGNPVRIITMTGTGSRIIRDLLSGGNPPSVPAVDELLVKLQAAGFLLPPIAEPTDHHDVTLVVPALSNPQSVRKMLSCLPIDLPVVLVDDGSPQSLVPLKSEHPGLTVVRHQHPRGPAAARNAGAALVTTPWIAFLDADTRPDVDWIAAMRAQIDQSNTSLSSAGQVVLAAPRIYPLPGRGLGGWFEQHVVALDLGEVAADVGVGKVVSYVPSAALLVRNQTFHEVGGFDESLLVGEDVDLVWRLAGHGRICYYPNVKVGHTPRISLLAALDRRRAYGASAADLSVRHPDAVRHLEVSVWSLGPWLVAIFAAPRLGSAAAFAAAASAHWRLRNLAGARQAHRVALVNHLRAAGMLGRWLLRPMLPVAVVGMVAGPGLRGRLSVAVGAGLVYLALLDVRYGRQPDDSTAKLIMRILESTLARTLDDAAYSVGVWQGVLRRRNFEPVVPRLRNLPGRWSVRGRRR